MERPRPLPGEPAARWYRSKIRSASPGASPVPESTTANAMVRASCAEASTSTVPPSGVWRSAFAMRLRSTSARRSASATRVGSPFACRPRSCTRAVSAEPVIAATASSTRSAGSTSARWSGSAPAWARATVRRSSISRSMSSVSSRRAARCASSRGRSPSSMPSSPPLTTVSGVRSSWLMSASSARRRSSVAARRSARVFSERAAARSSRGPRSGTRTS